MREKSGTTWEVDPEGKGPWSLSTLGLQAARCGGNEVEVAGCKACREVEDRKRKRNHEALRGPHFPEGSDEPRQARKILHAISTTLSLPSFPRSMQPDSASRTDCTNGLDFFALKNWDIPKLFLQEGSLGFLQRPCFLSSEML